MQESEVFPKRVCSGQYVVCVASVVVFVGANQILCDNTNDLKNAGICSERERESIQQINESRG